MPMLTPALQYMEIDTGKGLFQSIRPAYHLNPAWHTSPTEASTRSRPAYLSLHPEKFF